MPCSVCAQKRGTIVVPNEKNDLVPMRPVTGWKVCMDYRKLNAWTEKNHFPMLLMYQMLDRFPEKGFIVFLMGIWITIKSLLHRSIKRRPPLLSLIGVHIQVDAFWVMQCIDYFSKMYDLYIILYGGGLY